MANKTHKVSSVEVTRPDRGWNLSGFTRKPDGTLSADKKETIRTAYVIESYRLLWAVLKELRGLRRDLKKFRQETV